MLRNEDLNNNANNANAKDGVRNPMPEPPKALANAPAFQAPGKNLFLPSGLQGRIGVQGGAGGAAMQKYQPPTPSTKAPETPMNMPMTPSTAAASSFGTGGFPAFGREFDLGFSTPPVQEEGRGKSGTQKMRKQEKREKAPKDDSRLPKTYMIHPETLQLHVFKGEEHVWPREPFAEEPRKTVGMWLECGFDWSADGVPEIFMGLSKRAYCVATHTGSGSTGSSWNMGDFLPVDWSLAGLPSEFHQFGLEEEDDMVADWSANDLPVDSGPHACFWSSPAVDWSASGATPKIFSNGRWTQDPNASPYVRLDWSEPGVPHVFDIGTKRQKLREQSEYGLGELVVDWSRRGISKTFAFWDFGLLISGIVLTWPQEAVKAPTLPGSGGWALQKVSTRGGAQSHGGNSKADKQRNWSELYRKVTDSHLFTCPDGLILDWSGKGLPLKSLANGPSREKERARQIGDTLLTVDVRVDGMPVTITTSLPDRLQAAAPVDWSGAGIPSEYKASLFDKELAFDWSASGSPDMFKIGTPDRGLSAKEKRQKASRVKFASLGAKCLFSDNFTKINKRDFTFVADWTVHGLPVNFHNTWDLGGNLDWSKPGIPPMIKHAEYQDRDVCGFGMRVDPAPKLAATFILWADGAKVGKLRDMKKCTEEESAVMLSVKEEQSLYGFFARGVDWTEAGVPKAVCGVGVKEAARRAAADRPRGAATSLEIDWAHCASGQMPSCFRENAKWDNLAMDWSYERLPEQIREPYGYRTKKDKFAPLTLDWCADGIPAPIRHVWGGKTAYFDMPRVDWSGDGIPAYIAAVANHAPRHRDWPFAFDAGNDNGY
jgi:hypothetical protein